MVFVFVEYVVNQEKMVIMNSKTLRINITRARIIKLAIENYEEIAKLNFNNEEYAQLLLIKSLCEKMILSSQTEHITQTKQNKTQELNCNNNKVML